MFTHAIIDHDADKVKLYKSEQAMFQDAAYMLNCGVVSICVAKDKWMYVEVKETEKVRNSVTEHFLLTNGENLLTGPARGAFLLQKEWGSQLDDFEEYTVWQVTRTMEIQILMHCEKKPRFQLLDRVAGHC